MSEVKIIVGDSRVVLTTLADNSIDSVVTDPPYALVSIAKRFGKEGSAPAKGNDAYIRASKGFMSQTWDTGDTAHDPLFWREVYRVLKPGAHVLAFAGTRTYHRLACAIEDAGFEVRDMIAWLYGSGFPKSHNVSKSIDRAAGAEREVIGPGRWNSVKGDNAKQQDALIRPGGKHDETAPATPEAAAWEGWGTALKPAQEPIVVARKPLNGTVAANVLVHGTGALNIDGCRVEAPDGVPKFTHRGEDAANCYGDGKNGSNRTGETDTDTGRWPANVCHDGSDEVLAAFPDAPGQFAPISEDAPSSKTRNVYGERGRRSGGFAARGDPIPNGPMYVDSGSATRFFYCAKATTAERGDGNNHPTVKPIALMQWLCRLVTPPGGIVLDPFAGSGSTGVAADREGFDAIIVELSPAYAEIARKRLEKDAGLFANVEVTA